MPTPRLFRAGRSFTSRFDYCVYTDRVYMRVHEKVRKRGLNVTMPAFAQSVGSQRLGSRLPSDQERQAANQLRRIIAAETQSGQNATLKISGEDGQRADIVLTPGLSTLLLDLLRYIGQGDAVTLVPVTQMLTTQQAADILNVSRPFLIQLLERGAMDFTMAGRHRRIKAQDLFRYKAERDRARGKSLSELAELDADLI